MLWDIDGTLMRAGPVASEVFDRAIEIVLGRRPGPHGVQMSGKTDPQIAREILTYEQVGEHEIDSHVDTVIGFLERQLAEEAHRIREDGYLHAGIPEVLERLAGRGVRQSLLTGNVAANAAIKVGAFGLERWLDIEIGAYGSDDEDRRRLVPVALERLRTQRGVEIEPADVWIVGDTPNDLACARAGGARCLLVATGRITRAELDAAGADHVLDDLSDVDGVVELLLA